MAFLHRPFDLGEEFKNALPHFVGDADPAILDADPHVSTRRLRSEPDLTAFRGVFGGIIQQIG